MMERSGIITLLTDFGQQDGYAGAMKGVILGLHPTVRLIDISHEVEPHNVLAGAFLLQAHFHYFPPGTVHLAVVDPGVGSERAALACYAGEHFFVAPDNGLLDFCLDLPGLQAVRLTQPQYWRQNISYTFHGRDIFAPVAAHLAAGESLNHLGEPAALHRRLPRPDCRLDGTALQGQVVYIDRFGNLISNISTRCLREFSQDQPVTIYLAGHLIGGLSKTYTDVPPHTPLAVIGSFGFLEIAVNLADARRRFAAGYGTSITIERGQMI
ncbi:MAG: S-adenosyl-l-methionine hydroxide adenosyltransferase family protein [candidate division KSB1 bacterium]|nr:S-adenosyl-l-methionine hydroxide adenosyltransferase family protein [candidate division KSB1 bacterium]MDZ7368718.1 S-adenosyl-l-methionine hydroxide adenosyltransferase family protein [candidate division KSB1 bacterium]MDZ7406541.1 S-adenosyl-l-methionine hydroxide adenosyltransferase family protein [candidate division KSB1 bacterium]